MSGTQVAVTGAGGFIGGRLAELLDQSGNASARRITRRNVRLDEPKSFAAAIVGCRAVVHCAFDAYDEAANLAIADTIGRVCASASIRLVHISSAAVYEPLPDGILTEQSSTDVPGTSYTETKRAIERRLLEIVRSDRLDLVILQPTIVYGPRGGAWTDSPVRELLTAEILLPDAGDGLCNAVYVDDVCAAAMAACGATLPSGERILISGPGAVTWHAFLGAYEAILGTQSLRLEPAGRMSEPLQSSAASGPQPALRRIVLSRIGSANRSRLNFLLHRLRRGLRGRATLRSQGAKRALYEARCLISTTKAEHLLGYRSRFDLAAGMAATSPYLQQAYGRAHARSNTARHETAAPGMLSR